MQFNKFLLFFISIAFYACTENRAGADEGLASAFPLSSKTENIVPQDSLHLNANEGLYYFENKVFSGLAQSFYSNGILAAEIQMIEGKKNGFFKKYFENGNLSFSSEYVAGKKEGLSSTWWSNGNLRSEARFQNGIPHGIQKQWYKSGRKFKVLNYIKGKEEGRQQSWRENGKLYCNYKAINGRIFGLKRANLCYKLEDEEVQTTN